MVVLKELIFKFLLWDIVVDLKDFGTDFLTVSTLGGHGGKELEIPDF